MVGIERNKCYIEEGFRSTNLLVAMRSESRKIHRARGKIEKALMPRTAQTDWKGCRSGLCERSHMVHLTPRPLSGGWSAVFAESARLIKYPHLDLRAIRNTVNDSLCPSVLH
jgi:hypothetical protein